MTRTTARSEDSAIETSGFRSPRCRTTAATISAGLVVLAACAIPTDTPVWDTEWTACPSCPAGAVLKPAFDETVDFTPPAPVDVVGAVIVGGEARFTLSHEWGFDPLRPGGGELGSITIEVADEMGQPFGSATLDGAQSDFPSGSSRDVTVPLGSGELTTGGLVRVRVVSPEGTDATLDPAGELSVAVLMGSFLRATAVDVRIGDKDVESDPLQLDLSQVDSEVQSKVRRGALILFTNNTLDVGIGGALDVKPLQGTVISKALAVPKGEIEQRFELSLEEIQSILGQLVDLRARGKILGGPDNVVRVEPRDRLDLRLDLELSVRIGG